MKTINLLKIRDNSIPLEFDEVLPEKLYNKTDDEIKKTVLYYGNTEVFLEEYFTIKTNGFCEKPEDCTIIINGDLHRVKYIGLNMSCGTMIANSDVDLHAGAQMSGGHILINGDAESYAGREMTGGLLEINGNTKEYCGSSYIGEWRGMNGGKIIISGSVGKQLADCMLNGEIYIKGDCDILAGIHMVGGYIQIEGNVSQWPGGEMKNGTILINGHVDELLEGFILKEIVQNPKINDKYHFGRYIVYNGDIGANGKGELWINSNNNSELLL